MGCGLWCCGEWLEERKKCVSFFVGLDTLVGFRSGMSYHIISYHLNLYLNGFLPWVMCVGGGLWFVVCGLYLSMSFFVYFLGRLVVWCLLV